MVKGASYSQNAHSEGYFTIASGTASHAEGCYTIASGMASHAGGCFSMANETGSVAFGIGTIANQSAMTAIGKYNNLGANNDLFSVGYGSKENNGIINRNTVFNIKGKGNPGSSGKCTVDLNGDISINGNINLNGA